MKTISLFLFFLIILPLAHSSTLCGTVSPKTPPSFRAQLIVGTTELGVHKIWHKHQQHNLSYCISDRFGKDKDTITQSISIAAQDWMDHANIKFIHKPSEDSNCETSNTNVLFSIQVINSHRVPYKARAFFPHDPQSKRQVAFQRRLVRRGFTQLLGVVRHELGHVLGFRHEHIHPKNNQPCKEDNRYNPITDYDINSIMHYPKCGGTNTLRTLSKLDQEGASLIYPF